jgi:hypothetical protein
MIDVEVCTVYTPRPDHPNWRDDYPALMAAQRASALRADCSHAVVTDVDLPGFNCLRTDLPDNLMQAMIAGVVKRLEQPVASHLCFVDVDVLIIRSLLPVFSRAKFDIGLTYRANELAPINNGVMYVPKNGVAGALMFFREALRRCGTHWGADQEAISQAAAGVIHVDGEHGMRSGAMIKFHTSKYYAAVPKAPLARHDAYAVHFKGATKDWMIEYARHFQLAA